MLMLSAAGCVAERLQRHQDWCPCRHVDRHRSSPTSPSGFIAACRAAAIRGAKMGVSAHPGPAALPQLSEFEVRPPLKKGHDLLELTQNTIDAVNKLAQATSTGGLRVFGRQSEAELVLSAALVEGPADGDEIVEERGARVFLDSTAARALADKRLDTCVLDGRLKLTLLDET